jgi:c-di-GMP-binding flagellar brake protein YcgR
MKNKRRQVERRASARVDISLPITYNITIPPFRDKLKIKGVTKDVSARGISFVASNKAASSIMNLRIGLPIKDKGVKSKFINAKVNIIYSQPIAKGHKDILLTGVCFVELAKKDLILLKRLLGGIKNGVKKDSRVF